MQYQRILRFAFMVCAAALLSPVPARAQESRADTLAFCIPIDAGFARPQYYFMVLPAEGVSLLSAPAPSKDAVGRGATMRVTLSVPAGVDFGTFGVLRIRDGTRHLKDISIEPARRSTGVRCDAPVVTASASKASKDSVHQQGVGGTNPDLFADVAMPPAVNSGAAVRGLYTVVNFAERPVRVRIRIEVPEGWTLYPAGTREIERLVDTQDEIEGDFEIEAASDAEVGSGHPVRVFAEVIGEPGYADAVAVVRVLPRGGLKAGESGLSGSVQLAARGVGSSDVSWDETSALAEFSGVLGRSTRVTVNYKRGLRLDQPPILTTLSAEQSRTDITLRGNRWNAYVGNYLLSSGGTLSGPFVRGAGVSTRASSGRLQTDLTVARPVSFAGEYAGTLVRGGLQLNNSTGPVGIQFSDLQRPADRYTPGYHISGAGVSAQLDRGIVHANAQAGMLQLSGDSSAESSGASVHAELGLRGTLGSATVRWRTMPPAVRGTYLLGDDVSGEASLNLSPAVRLNGRGYRAATSTVGQSDYEANGLGAGIAATVGRGRVELRGNYRESLYQTLTTQRSVQLSAGTTAGHVSFNALYEIGRQTGASGEVGISNAFASMRWASRGTAVYSALSWYDYGTAPATLRFDVSASLRTAMIELDGGFWTVNGPNYGGNPVVWSNIVLPLPASFGLIAGGEYVHGRTPYIRYVDPVTGLPLAPEVIADPTRPPFLGIPIEVPNSPWRATLGLRRRLTIPL